MSLRTRPGKDSDLVKEENQCLKHHFPVVHQRMLCVSMLHAYRSKGETFRITATTVEALLWLQRSEPDGGGRRTVHR